ncbi:MAG: nucleoside recognition protein [Bacteroidales bacterium]|nr:nucleoside recognition protein [Bacteroidales bacterium]MBN2748177.1 nucleoside recognition protein [Bacteroidales bacterium]
MNPARKHKSNGTRVASSKAILLLQRIGGCVKDAIAPATKTAIWLLKITIPISLAVTLLQHFGVLNVVSEWLSPAFGVIGLRGEAALVYLTAAFLNIYSAIAVISSLPLNMREITILAVMCLIAHNLIVETTVQKRTGSKAWHIVLLRVGMSIVAAAGLNLLLPGDLGAGLGSKALMHGAPLQDVLASWGLSALYLCLKIITLVTLLMILQRILKEFGIIQILSNIFKPLLKIMGLPESTSFLWIVANTLGLAYGSAVMVEEVEAGKLSRSDADLLNFHIAISHSNLEDLLLFAAIGVSIWWMLIPRILIAIAAVWGRRFAVAGN